MKVLYFCAMAAFAGFATACNAEDKKVAPPLEHKLTDIDGKDYELSKLKGKVVLIVIVGVPSNAFGKQEPGTDEDIKKFCSTNYKVTFPMMSKVVIKGKGQIPLYESLVAATPDKDGKIVQVGWNFEKFLIGRDGKVAGRFKSAVEPMSDDMVKAVKKELDKTVNP